MLTEEAITELTFLTDEAAVPTVNDLSLRLLRHYTSTIRHQKFQGVDILAFYLTLALYPPPRALASLIRAAFVGRKGGL